MKVIFLILMALMFNSAYAADIPSNKFMSTSEQTEYIANKAKKIRRSYWIDGYEGVESSEYFVTKELLDDHVKQSNSYETHLDREEISQLYRCYYSQSCELYLVRVGSNYYGGYGEEAHFVLLHTKSKKSFTIAHTVYAE